MAHAGRYPSPAPPPPDAREAGVLMLLYPHQEEVYTVFIERAGGPAGDVHRGQISFPGGIREKEDADMLASAVREAEEEIGVPRSGVRVLRDLTPLYIPVSNFLVHPFVGMTDQRPDFLPQPEEVAQILEVPLRTVLDPAIRQVTDLQIHSGFTLKDVPYFDLSGHVVWGATAMILSEFQSWWTGD